MSGTPPPQQPAAADPSMEDILASIRRILSEDEPAAGAPAVAGSPSEDVVALDASMMVEEPPAPATPMATPVTPIPVMPAPVAAPPAAPIVRPTASASAGLLAPETEAAVASSMGGLLRTLIAEREQVAVYRGGPTLEDLVREEVRALLKHWLDTNLQPIVERQVRAEIERVVNRAL
ncbi:MAG: DUF2497 domain-containing protein [Alphaproteobacteria bacterium]|nr:DUF2497 domain-containing protein [Alphaproteobacteria bacterium]